MANLGLNVWYAGENAKVDIVFVHGLRGDREATWTKDGVLWPKELLAKDIPDARIIGYGYDSKIIHADSAQVMQGSIEDDARKLCSLLDDSRKSTDTTDRPIVTIGHSLGGLVLAQVIYGGERAATGDSLHSISSKVVGNLFLGTPFYGSATASWGDAVRRVLDWVGKETDRNTLKNLKLDSQTLKPLRDGYPETIRKRNQGDAKIAVTFCFEQLKLNRVLVVPEENARYPGVGQVVPVAANHRDICKFDDEEDPNYKIVKGHIVSLVGVATSSTGSTGNVSVTVNNHGKIVNLVASGTQNIQNQTNNL